MSRGASATNVVRRAPTRRVLNSKLNRDTAQCELWPNITVVRHGDAPRLVMHQAGLAVPCARGMVRRGGKSRSSKCGGGVRFAQRVGEPEASADVDSADIQMAGRSDDLSDAGTQYVVGKAIGTPAPKDASHKVADVHPMRGGPRIQK